jgi:hypothetical protein
MPVLLIEVRYAYGSGGQQLETVHGISSFEERAAFQAGSRGTKMRNMIGERAMNVRA